MQLLLKKNFEMLYCHLLKKIFNHQNSICDTNKNDKVNPNKEKNNNETKEVEVRSRNEDTLLLLFT